MMSAVVFGASLARGRQPVPLSPDGAVVLASIGFVLIVLELNRPGLIVAGAGGLLCLLLAIGAMLQYPVAPWAAGLLLVSVGLLGANLWNKLPWWLLTFAAVCGTVGLRFLVSPEASVRVRTPVALVCGLSSGALAAFLSRVALRARRAKQVN